jgi:Protein of unknown function (DUF3313)
MRRSLPPLAWRTVLAGALLAATAVAVATPRIQTGPNAEVTADGLHRIDGGTIADAWARPGVDLSRYSKILLLPAEMTFREVEDPGLRHDARDFPIDDQQRAKLADTIHEIFVAELGKSRRFTLTNEPGPDVLEIRGAIVDVVSHVPRQPIGRSAVFVKSLGEATLVVELRDSQTHQALARAFERRAAEPAFPTRVNTISTLADVRSAAQRWASLLRRRLDDFTVL